jgi:hypothetical protein
MLFVTYCNCINLIDVIQNPTNYVGRSVSISGDTIVVGARYEDSNATGVNGDQSNNDAAANSGADMYL